MTAKTPAEQQAEVEHLDFRPVSQTETHLISVGDAPDVPYKWGTGSIAVEELAITYRRYENGNRRIIAQVSGQWRNPDGEITDAPIDQGYADGPDKTWPDWVAGLTWYYHPEPHLIPKPATEPTP